MIATYNIKVNGRWYAAGEKYELEEKTEAIPEVKAEPEPEQTSSAPKTRTTSTRRKTVK